MIFQALIWTLAIFVASVVLYFLFANRNQQKVKSAIDCIRRNHQLFRHIHKDQVTYAELLYVAKLVYSFRNELLESDLVDNSNRQRRHDLDEFMRVLRNGPSDILASLGREMSNLDFGLVNVKETEMRFNAERSRKSFLKESLSRNEWFRFEGWAKARFNEWTEKQNTDVQPESIQTTSVSINSDSKAWLFKWIAGMKCRQLAKKAKRLHDELKILVQNENLEMAFRKLIEFWFANESFWRHISKINRLELYLDIRAVFIDGNAPLVNLDGELSPPNLVDAFIRKVDLSLGLARPNSKSTVTAFNRTAFENWAKECLTLWSNEKTCKEKGHRWERAKDSSYAKPTFRCQRCQVISEHDTGQLVFEGTLSPSQQEVIRLVNFGTMNEWQKIGIDDQKRYCQQIQELYFPGTRNVPSIFIDRVLYEINNREDDRSVNNRIYRTIHKTMAEESRLLFHAAEWDRKKWESLDQKDKRQVCIYFVAKNLFELASDEEIPIIAENFMRSIDQRLKVARSRTNLKDITSLMLKDFQREPDRWR